MAMDASFVGAAPGRDTDEEPTPIAARRADALAEIAETYMNNNESSGSTSDRYQVMVHVGTTDACDTNKTVGPWSRAPVGAAQGRDPYIEDGPNVPAESSRRIACDSSIVILKEDQSAEPLSIGRRSRTIPPPMRRALRARDKGCCFPGCTNTRFADGHHIQHWADGGETSLDNLVMLCRRHHHLVHEGGFACGKSRKGEIYFKDQRQQPLESSPALPGVAANDDVLQWMDREFFEASIDSETCTAKWYAGDRVDWGSAVGALFY
jgi:hypothetical protein